MCKEIEMEKFIAVCPIISPILVQVVEVCYLCFCVLLRHGDGTPHYLALVRDASVETVMQPIALEVDLLGHPIVERVIG